MIQDAINSLVKLMNDNPDKIDNIQIIKKGLILVKRPLGRTLIFATAVELLEYLES